MPPWEALHFIQECHHQPYAWIASYYLALVPSIPRIEGPKRLVPASQSPLRDISAAGIP